MRHFLTPRPGRRPRPRRHARNERGLSAGIGLISIAVGMAIVAVLLMVSTGTFSGGGGPGGTPSILRPTSAETQIKLCAEGRASSYGNPPSDAQQATCIRDLIGQSASGNSGSIPGLP